MMNRKSAILCLLSLWLAAAALPVGQASAEIASAGGNKLLIYYGTPEGVNGLWNADQAADLFAQYDHIVFGEGLELPSDGHHDSTAEVMRKVRGISPNVQFYGYIDLDYTKIKYPMKELKRRTDLWLDMGADGIFLDDAGYDYGGTRIRFNEIVRYIHDKNMVAFVNAWNPDDVLSSAYDPAHNSKSLKTAMDGRDIYLLESFLLPTDITKANSPSAFSSRFRTKMDKALYYRMHLGIRLMSVSSADYEQFSSDALRKFFRMNEAAAGVFSLDAYGVSPIYYSSAKPYHDLVRRFPYSKNYSDFYTRDVAYTAKYENRDFARAGFRLHSVQGDQYYRFPEQLEITS
ncbi:hypothetical protein J19TS2_24660 [Cohnella xylanilytica]|uniref:Glycoside-hydrolase family GH114 TIM-barrel domain-containing protein n=1 Tax=Cohnella xylanilytica TaxID=557555 RepID=A0A841U0S1_9BACL|nr:hypothetical protein [Cohnella xylanilytica]MBB6691524.1 hypothetical protein [Cohnella xylanilytica]GIO12911.1 hypothetical protein J19TS2_24660 [Cohnella xylanilytica]